LALHQKKENQIMKKYKEYMDGVRASDTLHQRLLDLEASGKRPVPWKKYGTAAALVLVAGTGGFAAWAAHINSLNPPIPSYPAGFQQAETVDDPQPDIAAVEPGDAAEPGMKTIGGYEVTSGNGPAAMTTYYILPYIEYGLPSGVSAERSLAPPDGGLRGATADDALALVGGEDALSAHLNWGGCEFDGTVGFEADGTVWMMNLWGESEEFAFSLALSPGRMPPSCVVQPEDAYTWTEVWGVKVAGIKGGAHGDTERGIYMDVAREVQFLANGVGCRLKVYGTQDGTVEEIVSRFVRYAILEGLDLSGISPEGAAPLDTDPGHGVDEPNWEDAPPETSAQTAAD